MDMVNFYISLETFSCKNAYQSSIVKIKCRKKSADLPQESVVVMDLSSNSLTYLQPESLPQSLKVLYLSNNFIASPDPVAFRSLRFLDLKMNRFHCDSNLKSFLAWLKKTKVTFLSPVKELRCEFPSSFHRVPLLDYSAQISLQ